MNVGQNKLPHTPAEVRQLAEQFDQVGEKLRGYARQMETIGLPDFSFSKGTAVNKHLFALQLWVAGLNSDWEKQRMMFEKGRAMGEKIRAAGAKRRGRPSKKSP